ncbi:MAG: flagellar biosynthesis repressor FlbT [Geminicoccaceae bacterium]
MAGLKLKLRPDERLLINGAVIQNGRRAAELTIETPHTHILRLRDAIHPDAVDTPVKRACYIAQMAVAGEAEPAAARGELAQALADLYRVLGATRAGDVISEASEAAEREEFYKALRALRKLLPLERMLLPNANTETMTSKPH